MYTHCAKALDYCFRWLSAAPSHRINALWVHPFILTWTQRVMVSVMVKGSIVA